MYATLEPDQSAGMGLTRYDFRDITGPGSTGRAEPTI